MKVLFSVIYKRRKKSNMALMGFSRALKSAGVSNMDLVCVSLNICKVAK